MFGANVPVTPRSGAADLKSKIGSGAQDQAQRPDYSINAAQDGKVAKLFLKRSRHIDSADTGGRHN